MQIDISKMSLPSVFAILETLEKRMVEETEVITEWGRKEREENCHLSSEGWEDLHTKCRALYYQHKALTKHLTTHHDTAWAQWRLNH